VSALRIACATAALLALAAGVSASAETPGSGLNGVLRRGPVTPVCVAERPCYVPLPNATIVFSGGASSKRVTTDRLGRYRVALAGGRYSVRAIIRGVVARVRPATVVVPTSHYARIGFLVDTGIR